MKKKNAEEVFPSDMIISLNKILRFNKMIE